MRDYFNNNRVYMINRMILNDEEMKEFEKYMEEYGQVPDRYLLREISRVQRELPNELKMQHINNLEQLSKMQGFVDDEIRNKINSVKRIIIIDNSSSTDNTENISEDIGYFEGSSLLLWFLLLTFLFRRRNYYYRSIRR
jgi:hypothetical protein